MDSFEEFLTTHPLDEHQSLIFYDFLYELWTKNEDITVGHVMDILVQYYD